MGYVHEKANTEEEKQRLARLRELGPPRPARSESPSSERANKGSSSDNSSGGNRDCWNWIKTGECRHGAGCTFKHDKDKKGIGKGGGKSKGKAKTKAKGNTRPSGSSSRSSS